MMALCCLLFFFIFTYFEKKIEFLITGRNDFEDFRIGIVYTYNDTKR